MRLKKLSFLIILLLFAGLNGFTQDFPATPNPPRLVSDYTNTLSKEQINQLENKLVAFEDSTSIQIAIVMIKSIGVYDVDDYAVKLAEKWGVGQEGKNNGIMILVALNDRKLSIQTGYGLEGALPDATAARIRLNEINPQFREGRYFEGLDKGTDAIIASTKGEYKNDKPKSKQGSGKFPWGLIILIIAVIFIISKKGGGGKGGQIIGSRGGSSLFWWTLMAGMGNRGGGSGFGGGGGGFGGGGGGFGGFGGGSFGGGGSGGSW